MNFQDGYVNAAPAFRALAVITVPSMALHCELLSAPLSRPELCKRWRWRCCCWYGWEPCLKCSASAPQGQLHSLSQDKLGFKKLSSLLTERWLNACCQQMEPSCLRQTHVPLALPLLVPAGLISNCQGSVSSPSPLYSACRSIGKGEHPGASLGSDWQGLVWNSPAASSRGRVDSQPLVLHCPSENPSELYCTPSHWELLSEAHFLCFSWPPLACSTFSLHYSVFPGTTSQINNLHLKLSAWIWFVTCWNQTKTADFPKYFLGTKSTWPSSFPYELYLSYF